VPGNIYFVNEVTDVICKFCVGKNIELERIPLGVLATYDFDNDGKPFLFCPECFHCDNVNLIEERRIQRSILENQSLISNRHYRAVIHQLSFRFNGFSSDEERRIFVSDICGQMKLKRDDEKVAFIASSFHTTTFRVILMILTVVRRRNYHHEKKSRQNWRVISAKEARDGV